MTTTESDTSVPTDPPKASNEGVQPRDRTPWLLGFLCFLIPALPTFVVLPGPLKSNGSPARIIAMVLFGLIILTFVAARRTAHPPRVSPGALVLLVYLLLWLTTYGSGLLHFDPSPDRSIIESSMTRSLISLFANVGIGLFVIARVRTARQCNIVLGCLAAGLVFACLVGLLQSVGSTDLRFLFQPPGFVLNTDELSLVDRAGVSRATGTSQHPIEFAVLAAATVPLTMYLARNSATRNRRIMAAAGCFLALIAMPAAVARTGIIALATALLIYMFALKVRQIAVGLIVGSCAIGSYIVAFPHITHALWATVVNSEEDPSVLGRLADYATVSESFRTNPLFGIGLGGSPPATYGYLDNQWLQAIVQGGVVGVIALTMLAGGGIFGFAAALRCTTTPPERERAYMLGSVFVAILVSSFTFDVMGFQQATFVLFVVFGLLWSNFRIPLPAESARLSANDDAE